MNTTRILLITMLLAAFGLLTTFLTTSIIFDLFNIRQLEGNYVPLVVWANLVSGLCFLTTAFAYLSRKLWATTPLVVSLLILVAAFLALIMHINTGGAYETKTVGAMLFRIALNVLFLVFVRSQRKKETRHPLKTGSMMLAPLAFLAMSCGHADNNHQHEKDAGDAHHHHANNASALQLNDGHKWEADAHTRSLVKEMKQTISEFEDAESTDYNTLSDSLTSELNRLVAGCTMEGPAHDELHKWLIPVTKNMKALSSRSNSVAPSDAIHEIEASLDAFDEYFE